MTTLTEKDRRRLIEFRRQTLRRRIWLLRRKLLLLLGLALAAAAFYYLAHDPDTTNPLPLVSSLWL